MDGWNIKPNGWESMNINVHLKNKKYDNMDKYKNLDIIFVLAGGLDKNGNVYPFVEERLNLAIEIYKSSCNIKIVCLGGGTYHKPPVLNSGGYIIHESTACSEYLIKNGVNSKDIYKEWSSYDTIANGFFAYTNFVSPLNIKNFLIITSEFHYERSKLIFDWIMSLDGIKREIYYERMDNIGIEDEDLIVRKMREKQSVNNLVTNVIPKIQSLKDLHEWFYGEHKAYCSNSEIIRECDISETAKKTY